MKEDEKVICSTRIGDDMIPQTPKEFLEFFKNEFDKIPRRYRDSIQVHCQGDRGYDNCIYGEVKITWKRPPTPQEIKSRIEDEKKWEEIQRQKELDQLAKLKEKYPDA